MSRLCLNTLHINVYPTITAAATSTTITITKNYYYYYYYYYYCYLYNTTYIGSGLVASVGVHTNSSLSWPLFFGKTAEWPKITHMLP